MEDRVKRKSLRSKIRTHRLGKFFRATVEG